MSSDSSFSTRKPPPSRAGTSAYTSVNVPPRSMEKRRPGARGAGLGAAGDEVAMTNRKRSLRLKHKAVNSSCFWVKISSESNVNIIKRVLTFGAGYEERANGIK